MELDDVEQYDDTTMVGQVVLYTRIDPKKDVRDIAERKVLTKAEKENMLTRQIRESGLTGRDSGSGSTSHTEEPSARHNG